jgi:hypothetical protein
MAASITSITFLQCDSCDVLFPPKMEHTSSTAARIAAAQAGWSLINRVKWDGKPATSEYDDLCPSCAPNWTPSPARKGNKGARSNHPGVR